MNRIKGWTNSVLIKENRMKTILITGSTDGIGQSAASMLAAEGHHVLVHGRNQEKLQRLVGGLKSTYPEAVIEGYRADLSNLGEVKELIATIKADHKRLDVLITNAGVYNVANPILPSGQDVRFVVNTIAPYLLAKELLPIIPQGGRIVNLSSAAQSPVNEKALMGTVSLDPSSAYAQSKLGLTMWSALMGQEEKAGGRVVVSVNPKSFLGSKMVKEAYGMEGYDINIGGEILRRAAEGPDFEQAYGKYFDNDRGSFASPHPDAMDVEKCKALVEVIEALL